MQHDRGFILHALRVERLQILAEPATSGFVASESKIEQSKEQRRFDPVATGAFEKCVGCHFRVVVHPRGDGNQCVGKPVTGTGQPQFLAEFLDGFVANQIDVEIADHADDGSADAIVIAELFLDNLVDANKVLVGELHLFAFDHVLTEFADATVDLISGFLDLLRGLIHLGHGISDRGAETLNGRIQLIDCIFSLLHDIRLTVLTYCALNRSRD